MRTLEQQIVLLAQPDADTCEMYGDLLRLHGFVVLAFSDADEALQMAPVANIVITDVRLRGATDGLQLIARLRCDERTRHTPVIVLTACAFPYHQARAEAVGCDRFLPIPCLPDRLLREVQRFLPRQLRASRAGAHR